MRRLPWTGGRGSSRRGRESGPLLDLDASSLLGSVDDGGRFGSWPNKGTLGGAADASNPASNRWPYFQETGGPDGGPAVRFQSLGLTSGGGTYLLVPEVLEVKPPFTVVLVSAPTSLDDDYIWDGALGGASEAAHMQIASTTFEPYMYAGGPGKTLKGPTPLAVGRWDVHLAHFGGDEEGSYLRTNGVQAEGLLDGTTDQGLKGMTLSGDKQNRYYAMNALVRRLMVFEGSPDPAALEALLEDIYGEFPR